MTRRTLSLVTVNIEVDEDEQGQHIAARTFTPYRTIPEDFPATPENVDKFLAKLREMILPKK